MIYPIDRFAEIAKAKDVTVVISTVPSKYSQSAVDEIIKGNVIATLNFAPDRVTALAYINVQYVDLIAELQTLTYFDKNYSGVLSQENLSRLIDLARIHRNSFKNFLILNEVVFSRPLID